MKNTTETDQKVTLMVALIGAASGLTMLTMQAAACYLSYQALVPLMPSSMYAAGAVFGGYLVFIVTHKIAMTVGKELEAAKRNNNV